MVEREELFYQMTLVRSFEERVLELFDRGELFGTTHCYIGQEANAVGVLSHLEESDIVVSNHRCHGHYIIRTGDVAGLLGELMGKAGGVCGGRGGSQHLCKGNFFTNGIQGSIMPVAAGMAYAEKRKGGNAIGVVFIGDGTLGQGTVYETFNMLSLWSVPLLVVVEDNCYAQTTPKALNLAGSFTQRAAAFGLSTGEIESNDAEELLERFGPIIDRIRRQKTPHVEFLHTYRLCAHSKGDDFRPEREIEIWRKKDPVGILGQRLEAGRREALEERAREHLFEAEEQARKMPMAKFPASDITPSHTKE